MSLATTLCHALSKRLMKAPEVRTADQGAYQQWREDSLTRSWARFADSGIAGKDVLDFGCGEGHLGLFIAGKGLARSVVGVEIDLAALAHARANAAAYSGPTPVSFLEGGAHGLPVADASVDTILAFDCLEHVMDPAGVVADWFRVLRPNGRVLIEWFPFRGPWGPHMEALIPIPWAHVLFGEKAMFATAAAIYEDPAFVPRHWDLDETGAKKPNKWTQWQTFAEQAYVNQLTLPQFTRIADRTGFTIDRLDRKGFGSGAGGLRQRIGDAAMAAPFVGEYFTSHYLIELVRP